MTDKNDELLDQTERDDILFSLDNPGGVDIPVSVDVEQWDRKISMDTMGETELKVEGPSQVAPNTDPYLQIGVMVEDDRYDECGAIVDIGIDLDDARRLAALLGEVVEEPVDVQLDEPVGGSEDVDDCDGGGSDGGGDSS